jgi:purine-binding chemotaxis protein CheW
LETPVAAAETPGEVPARVRQVVFRAGGERFALPLEAVREVVVPQPPYARVPRAPAAVRGAMNLRGRVVAVVELAPIVGLPADVLAPGQGNVIVLDREKRGLGVLVAGVLGVEAVEPPRAEPREAAALARGVVEARGMAVTVLDPDALAARALALFDGAVKG